MPTSRFEPVDLGMRPVLDQATKQRRAGLSWHAYFWHTPTALTSATVLITTPSTGTYHLQADVAATGNYNATFSEAPNASGGSALTSANLNRSSSTADTLTLTTMATYVSAGTVMQNVRASASFVMPLRTWILGVSKLYLIRATPWATAQDVFINLYYWRES